MKKFLSLLLVAAMALSLLSVSALAEEPVKIDMFYQSSRPMNEFTELTRQKVIEDVGVDMNLIQGGDNWKQQAGAVHYRWRCAGSGGLYGCQHVPGLCRGRRVL